MSKKTTGLVGAISALPLAASALPLAAVGPAAHAHTLDEVMAPRSYAELLQSIPNAAALLGEAKAREELRSEPRIQTAQYYGGWGGYYGQPYYHHHHHHHHPHHHWNGGWW